MKLALINLFMGVVPGWILITQFGVVGLILTHLIAGFPSLAIGLWWLRKHYRAKVDLVASAKIFMASAIAAVFTYLLLAQLNFSYWIELAAGGVSFLCVYLVTAPMIKAVDKKDVRHLREMLSGLGPFSYVFNIPLGVIEKLSDIFDF